MNAHHTEGDFYKEIKKLYGTSCETKSQVMAVFLHFI